MAGEKILLVDDEPYLLRSLSFVLGREGYVVRTASDGEEGLALFGEFDPDIVFLDLMMPKKDGYEVCHAIRNDAAYRERSPYIIILTCKGQDVDRYKVYLEGADDYVTKPFSPADVVSRVEEYLDARRRRQA